MSGEEVGKFESFDNIYAIKQRLSDLEREFALMKREKAKLKEKIILLEKKIEELKNGQ